MASNLILKKMVFGLDVDVNVFNCSIAFDIEEYTVASNSLAASMVAISTILSTYYP